ncbi:hypothetical protein X766_34125 [Mesorhizobium sp. LSJC255A00]|nr:hypothetical protein X766_34125 [Mesorhizobium sp. LSJC255A00]
MTSFMIAHFAELDAHNPTFGYRPGVWQGTAFMERIMQHPASLVLAKRLLRC